MSSFNPLLWPSLVFSSCPTPGRPPFCKSVWQTVGGVLAPEGERSGAPSRSDLSAALFAACAASCHDDAVAVLFLLLQSFGEGTADARDEAGRTSLHHACRGDDVDMSRILRQANANLEARDREVR